MTDPVASGAAKAPAGWWSSDPPVTPPADPKIIVHGPNGVSVNFPAGTDSGTINGVMAQHLGGGQSAPSGPLDNYAPTVAASVPPPPGPWSNYAAPTAAQPSARPQIVQFEGQQHSFPADFSRADILAALSSLPATPQGWWHADPPAADPWADFCSAPPAAPAPSVAADVAKSGGIGLVKGTIGLAGMPGDLAGHLNRAIDAGEQYVGGKLGLNMGPAQPAPEQPFGGSSQIQSAVEKATGSLYQPQTTAGKYAQTIGEFAPAAIGGPEALGARLLKMVAAPAVASEALGQATEGTALEPYARVGGAIAGGGAASLLKGGASGATAAAIPTAQELKAAAQAAYKSPEVAAVEIRPQAVTNLAQQIESDLTIRGFRPTSKSASDTFAEVRGLQVPPGVSSVKVADLDTARQALGRLTKEVDSIGQPTTEAAAAQRAISKIDDFLPNLNQSDLLAGDATKANSILTEARGNYKAYKQASLIDTKQANAELQAASTYGGGNINNATRQAFRPLLKNNAAGASGFSPEAIDQLNRVVTGGPVGNVARQLGRLAPTGPVNMGLHVGAALGTGGATIPVAVGAYGAKKVGEAITRSEVGKLNDIVRSQSPLARATVPPPVAAAPTTNPRLAVLMRAALGRMGGNPAAPVAAVPDRQRAPFAWSPR